MYIIVRTVRIFIPYYYYYCCIDAHRAACMCTYLVFSYTRKIRFLISDSSVVDVLISLIFVSGTRVPDTPINSVTMAAFVCQTLDECLLLLLYTWYHIIELLRWYYFLGVDS